MSKKTTSVLKNICDVFSVPVPKAKDEIIARVNYALKAPEELQDRFLPQTVEYLDDVKF